MRIVTESRRLYELLIQALYVDGSHIGVSHPALAEGHQPSGHGPFSSSFIVVLVSHVGLWTGLNVSYRGFLPLKWSSADR